MMHQTSSKFQWQFKELIDKVVTDYSFCLYSRNQESWKQKLEIVVCLQSSMKFLMGSSITLFSCENYFLYRKTMLIRGLEEVLGARKMLHRGL